MDADSSRQHERLQFQQRVVVEFDHGRRYSGVTKDVSLRGCLLELRPPPNDLQIGQQGIIRLEIMGEIKEFPCTIANIQSTGIGLDIDRQSGRFGFALTNAIFSSMGMQLGASVQKSLAHLQVGWEGSAARSERPIRISLRKIEFCNHRPPDFLPIGKQVTCQLAIKDLPTVTIVAEVIRHASLADLAVCPGGKSICHLYIPAIMDLQVATNYYYLVQAVQRQSLNTMMQEQATVHACLDAPAQQEKNRDDKIKDYQRFFSHIKSK